MTVVGFNFTKISSERMQIAKGKINIKNNITITNVDKTDLAFGSSTEAGLLFNFEFKSSYEPNVGEIIMLGDVLYLTDSKKVKEVLDQWKKDKKIPNEIWSDVLNNALSKCNIQALLLSRDINLPPPIPLPKVGVRQKD
jgi:hypothetical protein